MSWVVSFCGVLGLLLMSVLSGLFGDLPSPDLRAHPGDPTQTGVGATEPRRPPPPKNQRERARAGALPLGALYTAAVVAFVLYKCLQQGKDETAVTQEEADKESLQSEQQLAQLTEQLAQTEQHLNHLMAQLDPLFECVTTLTGAQQELLNMKLQTIHHLLQERKPDKGVEVPEAEATMPFPEDLCIEEAGESPAWEESRHWSTETWNLATAWEVEQGLRRRGRAAKGLCHSPSWKEGETAAEGLVKQSLFL
ncbi:PREDICTED: LOW QUALITY PROTEIN: coiled-coil domain-containing protein 107 [Chrysochloris asiatica]|uniref:LOW QUALITY PROTEIN: coiled-coil domain-containing protein 107 n=1 Tax=Chrysochloris asiatica TaxID=185453 RepID=A0A9B0TLV4_CHRAS|nr:PREDICTED: LOW QUALITY PROTEIN: coiled-coil domain-containing protein 107 [Chrysochloris asiatica]